MSEFENKEQNQVPQPESQEPASVPQEAIPQEQAAAAPAAAQPVEPEGRPVPQLTLEPDPPAPSISFPDPPQAPQPPPEPVVQQSGPYHYNGGQPKGNAGYQPPQYTQSYTSSTYQSGYQAPNYTAQNYQPPQPQAQPKYTEPPVGYHQRSRLAAGLLAIILGSLGIHNFYLGFNTRGTIQLVLALAGGLLTCGVGTVAAAIWGFIEGVLLLSGNNAAFDGNGVILRD